MLIIEYLVAAAILTFVIFFTYMGWHMACEKDKGDYIPLPWEPEGFLYKLWQNKSKIFDKNDVKYRDGDNT